MGKKMKLPFIFKTPEAATTSWPWPTCGSPKTLSFRASAGGGDVFINSAYVDGAVDADTPADSETGSWRSPAVAEELEESGGGSGGESVEAVIRGLRSVERLFCEPGETSSIMEEAKSDDDGFPFKESVAVAMESENPYADFKRSMAEMVEAHGVKDWDCLEELLSWYLRFNGKTNHGYIVGAFVDLLVGLAFKESSSSSPPSSSSSSPSPISPLSFSSSTSFTSPCLSSSLEAEDEIEKRVSG